MSKKCYSCSELKDGYYLVQVHKSYRCIEDDVDLNWNYRQLVFCDDCFKDLNLEKLAELYYKERRKRLLQCYQFC